MKTDKSFELARHCNAYNKKILFKFRDSYNNFSFDVSSSVALKRPYFCDFNLKKKTNTISPKIEFKTSSRSSIINKKLSNYRFFYIHNGMHYQELMTMPNFNYIGDKLGEYSITKKICIYKRKKLKKRYRI